MLILTGPPGSGKTHFVLERLRQDLDRGAGRVRLIAPTATMAEHLRNQLAREGRLVRAGAIQTLARFLESLVGASPEVSAPVFQSLVRAALDALDAAAFDRVRDYPGFQAALAALTRELDSAGWDPSLGPLPSPSETAIAGVFTRVREAVRERGLSTRGGRLRAASALVRDRGLPGVDALLFDGFYAFAPVELDLIVALAGAGLDVVVTLPDWEGAGFPKRVLVARGFKEQRLDRRRPAPRSLLVTAANLEEEVREIARRILAEAASGRPFREMGVIVRGYEPYVPALIAAFERFGIPARYYFGHSLGAHPAVARIARLIDALLDGWDHERALAAVRLLPPSETLDRFEFTVLETLPGKGVAPLASAAGHRLRALLEAAAADLGDGAARPPQEWSARLASLAALFPLPDVRDGVDHEQAFLWRSHAAALDSFVELVSETAKAFGDGGAAPLDAFWAEVKANLGTASFWPRDRRRNVVAVMDAYEARQWELPVVFLCGLVEKQFPRHHFEDPLLGDEARLRLRGHGIHLRTSAEANAEERFLFELAVARATELLALSYPKYNSKGDDNLPSFLLQALLKSAPVIAASAVDARPAPARPRVRRSSSAIQDARLLEWLAEKHATLSASSIQRFLECPFSFFAERSLRLNGWPDPPRERLNPPLQGEIVHNVIAACLNMPLMLDQTFDEIFRESIRNARVPDSYRTEAVRLEMLASLRDFLRQPLATGARETLNEREFTMPLDDGISVCGRIDRIDVLKGRKALVIDYKYAAGYRMRDYIAANEQERSVQAGLYLSAARAVLGVEPVGMLFCTMRRSVEWDGWLAEWPGGDEIGARCDSEYLRQLAARAVAATMAVARAIRQGRIEPAPSDASICERCDHRDICRVETEELVTVAGGRRE